MSHNAEGVSRPRNTKGDSNVKARLFEVNIAVRDFDAAVKKFSEVLGVQPIFMKDSQMPVPGLKSAVFPIGEPVGQVIIGITASADPDTPLARFLESKGEGVYVVGVEVDDIEENMKQLVDKGVKFVSDEPIPYVSGRMNLSLPSSMHGVQFCFAEHKDGYWEDFVQGAEQV